MLVLCDRNQRPRVERGFCQIKYYRIPGVRFTSGAGPLACATTSKPLTPSVRCADAKQIANNNNNNNNDNNNNHHHNNNQNTNKTNKQTNKQPTNPQNTTKQNNKQNKTKQN